jgi:hypothetical protein
VHGEGTRTPEDCHSDEFMARGIIVKLPPSLRDFATALKTQEDTHVYFGLDHLS